MRSTVLFVLVAGCSGGSNPGPSGTATVGPAGGVVATASGASVNVPSGALGQNITVTISEGLTFGGTETVVGGVYLLGPEGQQFMQPVAVTLPFDPNRIPMGFSASDLVMFTAPKDSATFVPLAGRLSDSTHFTTEVTHFSQFVVGVAHGDTRAPDAAPSEAGSPEDAFVPVADAQLPSDAAVLCPTEGQQRWCDGRNFCSWGKQTCQLLSGGTLAWGACIEGDPQNPPIPAPTTTCACYFPFAYNAECCETPDCVFAGQQNAPCSGTGGTLCAACGSDANCAANYSCIRAVVVVQDTPNNTTGRAIEQFCTRTCTSAATDCGAGYNCVRPSGSPTSYCFPADQRCDK